MDGQKGYTYKIELRRELLLRRKSVSDKPALMRAITANCLPLIKSGNALVYIPIGDELDTSELIGTLRNNAAVTVYAPYTVDNEIIPLRLIKQGAANRLGNLPPECYNDDDMQFFLRDKDGYLNSLSLDCCITPVVGFTQNGYRLGYGKGCFDRLFAKTKVYKIGFAYDFSLCDFDHEPHDVPLDCCVTPSKVIYFNK